MCTGNEEKYLSDGRPREKRKKRKSSTTTCPFMKQVTLENFRDLALVGGWYVCVKPCGFNINVHGWQAEVQDIEQLVGLGRHLGACPYYGTRHAIPSAQVYLCNPYPFCHLYFLPFPSLLSPFSTHSPSHSL